MAIVSLVLGVLGIVTAGLTGLIGLVLGIMSLVKINRSAGSLQGRGLAIAGICVSGFWVMMIPIMAAMVFPVFARARESAKKAICLSNVKNICIALEMYAADHDNHLPSANAWSDDLRTYVRNLDTYQCPSEQDLACAYAYNASLSGASLADIADPVNEVSIFESNAGWNAAGDWGLLVPEPRHLGGDNYGYADGHAAWEVRDESYGSY
jgi:prepilin-type processing-associated H-X9-DG protein